MERFKRGIGIVHDADSVSIQPKYVDSCQKFVGHLGSYIYTVHILKLFLVASLRLVSVLVF